MKIIVIFAVVATLALLLVAPVGPAAADPRCPVQAEVCIFELPADVQAAQRACFRAEREARGIPAGMDAYLAWWEANRGTPAQLDWTRAHTACRHNHTQPGGMWNWSGLVFVGWR